MTIALIQSRRSLLYFRKYAFENRRAFLFLYLAIAAFLVLWLGVYLNFTNRALFAPRAQAAYYFVTLFLAGCLSSGMLFSELGSKSKAIHYLLIPASTWQKFICGVFFSVVVFFVVYSCIFYVVDYAAVHIANYKYGTDWEVINLFHLERYPNVFAETPLTDIFYLFFPVQAIFLLCSVYFKKHGLFKAIVCMGLLWVFFIALMLTMGNLLPAGKYNDSMGAYEIVEANGDNKLVFIPAVLTYAVLAFFKVLLTPMLWVVGYLKLQEKEL